MRTITGGGLVLALVLVVAAESTAADPDAKKLPGKWEAAVKERPGLKLVVEFGKDGKMTVAVTAEGKSDAKAGTYKLDGDKLMVQLEGEKGAKTSTVLKLTDDTLQIKNATGTTTTFARLKEK